MKKINWFFLFLALLGTISLAGIGISVAEESLLGFLISILLFISIVGFGFMKKKKMREKGVI